MEFFVLERESFLNEELTSYNEEYNEAIKIREASNAIWGYAIVDFICNRTHQVDNWCLSYVRKVKQTI